MSKRRFNKKKNKSIPIWLIAVLFVTLVLLVILAVTLERSSGNESKVEPSESAGETIVQTNDHETTNEQINETEDTENINHSEAPDTSGETDDIEEPISETEPAQIETPQPTVVVVQRADAEYEKWLSAAMIVSVSMEYPDFQLEGIYAASATALEDKLSSNGVYIIFSSGGTRIAIHSKALEGERAVAGTVDISSEAIGFATFDKVDPAVVNVSSFEQIALEDLSDLIAQSLLVSIYTH